MKERYALLTRDLDWTPTYVRPDDVFPYTRFEGIKIHDWSGWEDPFRLTVDSYCKYQAEKDKKLYAVMDAFAQGQGHLSISDARYFNAMKLFIQAVSPLEYASHRLFAFLGRHLDGPGARFAALCQSIDELRHLQTQVHTISQYNKYYAGMHSFPKWFDRVWYLSVPKSIFDDSMSAGPFEALTAISFSFEYMFTNLLFVPWMSGASFNGDLATMTFGFSAQSDESRHMTLGLEVLKFMLEQDEGNVPIIQDWMHKWFWRGYRLLAVVAAMMDYMLPKKFMSWKESFELYFEDMMIGGLFGDLEYYGIAPPLHMQQAIQEKEYLSHAVYWALYHHSPVAAFTTTIPTSEELGWLSASYPETFDRHYRPLWDKAQQQVERGGRLVTRGLPMLCQVCQFPLMFPEPGDPSRLAVRTSRFKDERYNFCSDGCQWIFDREPQKYVQAWLPAHQIYLGNCGGPTIPDVLAWYGFEPDDGGEYLASSDKASWEKWHAPSITGG
jgi:phenol hydroxylase P3 protein